MLFSSNIFFYLFLPLFLALYLVVPARGKNSIILIFSLVFYYYGEQNRIFFLLLSIFFNWTCGLIIANNGFSLKAAEKLEKSRGRSRLQKGIVGVAITGNLLLLGYFKYLNFFIDNINSLLVTTGIDILPELGIIMPIGISFFTFQALSYVADIYRGEVAASNKLLVVATYISMFPQLIAGPIVRYSEICEQLAIKRRWNLESFSEGIFRFTVGFAKKILIANSMAVCADKVFSLPPSEIGTLIAWIGILAYTLQIYFDFSGYSDMAIGLGKMIGLTFPENFNYPYTAVSITDFWRRWHMTLSRFFRDYLYIPLGGNRKGPIRTYINLLVVFILCGFWHGASWNFIVWGGWFGLFLVIERIFLLQLLQRFTFPARIYTLLVVIVGWVFFRADTLNFATTYLQTLFDFSTATRSLDYKDYLTSTVIIFGICGIVGSAPTLKLLEQKLFQNTLIYQLSRLTMISGLLYVSLIELALTSYNPFLYFRF